MESEFKGYSICLCQFNLKCPLSKMKRNQDLDKLIFLKHEQDKKYSTLELMKKTSLPIYKKTIYGQTSREGTIRSLLTETDTIYRNKIPRPNKRPKEGKTLILPSTARDNEKKFSFLKEDPILYKGQEMAFPCLTQIKSTRGFSSVNKQRQRLSTSSRNNSKDTIRDYIESTRKILIASISIKEKLKKDIR